VHGVDLAGQEGFDDLGPAAEHAGLFDFKALVLEELVVMRHQQGRGVGDGQIADAQRGVGLGGARGPAHL